MKSIRDLITLVEGFDLKVGQPLGGVGGGGTSNSQTTKTPQAQTTAPAQPVAPTDDNAQGIGAESIPVTGNRNDDPAVNRTAPGSRPDLDPSTIPPATAPGSRPDLDTTTVPPAAPAAPAAPNAVRPTPGGAGELPKAEPAAPNAVRPPTNNAQLPGEPQTFRRDTSNAQLPGEPETFTSTAPTNATTAGPDDGTRAGQEPNRPVEEPAAPAGDSLAGKLDTETPSLMDKYNAGGKKSDPAVKDLQTALSRLGFDPNGVDGKYGKGTFAAVQAFQKANGLTVDGEAGPNTMKKLQELLNAQGAGSGAATPAATAAPAAQGDSAADVATDDAARQQQAAAGARAAADNPQAPGNNPDAVADIGPVTTTSGPAGGPAPEGDAIVASPSDADIERFNELLSKLQGPEQQNQSVDFRHLIAIVEGKLNEALSAAEMQEFEALIAKLRASPDAKHKELASRGETVITTTGKIPPQTGGVLDTTTTMTTNKTTTTSGKTSGKSATTNNRAQIDDVRTGKADFVKQAEKALLAGEDVVAVNDIWMSAITDIAKADRALRLELQSAFIGYMNKKYNGGSDTNFDIRNTNDFLQQIQRSNGTNAPRQGSQRDDFSWDNDVSNKTQLKDNTMENLEECGGMPMPQQDQGSPVSMNVTLSARGDQHVQDLLRMMQLAGAKDAAPVADMHVGPMDKHDDMVSLMRIADGEMGPEESVEEEWDNSPNEDYKDHNYMTKDLSGGLNRQKPKGSERVKDPAVESIKSQLLKALSETGYKK